MLLVPMQPPMLRTGEKLKPHHLLAFGLALAGMGLIATHNGHGTSFPGLSLVLVAALGWALGNQASREAGKVNISGSTYGLVKNDFKCVHRGKIPAKNKGEVDMYFVEGKIG